MSQPVGKSLPQIMPHVHVQLNGVLSEEAYDLPSVSTKGGKRENKCINYHVLRQDGASLTLAPVVGLTTCMLKCDLSNASVR